MKFTRLILITLIAFAPPITLAQSQIVTETTTWQSVPIEVDTSTNTYTIVGTVPTTTTDFYYSYSGHRCFVTKRDLVGVDPITLKATVSDGNTIYCYPE